jgi:hypothetical protein
MKIISRIIFGLGLLFVALAVAAHVLVKDHGAPRNGAAAVSSGARSHP